jgi:transcriptional regulator with XRE-family HTH domain
MAKLGEERAAQIVDDVFRDRLRELLERTGCSMRQLSGAFGRDPGYVQSLLDASRPSRARPTPSDMLRASDATGIPFVELLELLWEIPAARLAEELASLGVGGGLDPRLVGLSDAQRASVADYIDFLATRHERRPTRRQSRP